MASKKLLELLNDAIARELQVSIQYMWQHVLWSGPAHFAVKDEFKTIAVQEMKHAEAIAERLNFLGGIPTTKPTTINVGNNLKEMLQQNKKDERMAIDLYKKILALANKDGDITTARMFEKIIEEEEEHLDTFSSLLEGL